jgi:hypothetical protein
VVDRIKDCIEFVSKASILTTNILCSIAGEIEDKSEKDNTILALKNLMAKY